MAGSVVLFKKDGGIISKLIAKVTGSDITHSAVLYEGQLFDASERRGNFGRANINKLKARDVEVYPLGASVQQLDVWLVLHNGKKYDYAGVLQWALYGFFGRFFKGHKLNQTKKVYCFEATAALLTKITGVKYPANISGDHLRRTLGSPIYTGRLSGFLNHV